jgi:hypothetical protein
MSDRVRFLKYTLPFGGQEKFHIYIHLQAIFVHKNGGLSLPLPEKLPEGVSI